MWSKTALIGKNILNELKLLPVEVIHNINYENLNRHYSKCILHSNLGTIKLPEVEVNAHHNIIGNQID